MARKEYGDGRLQDRGTVPLLGTLPLHLGEWPARRERRLCANEVKPVRETSTTPRRANARRVPGNNGVGPSGAGVSVRVGGPEQLAWLSFRV